MKHQYMNITDVGTYELNLGRKSDDLGLTDKHVNSHKKSKEKFSEMVFHWMEIWSVNHSYILQ